MRVVIVGGGMAGAVLAGALRRRGVEPVVLERGPATATIPGPIMLPYQAYDALADLGLLEEVRAAGRPIAPQADGTPVAIAVARQALIDALRRDVPIRFDTTVTGLLRDGDRIVGVETDRGADRRRPGGRRRRLPARPCARWPASRPRCARPPARPVLPQPRAARRPLRDGLPVRRAPGRRAELAGRLGAGGGRSTASAARPPSPPASRRTGAPSAGCCRRRRRRSRA